MYLVKYILYSFLPIFLVQNVVYLGKKSSLYIGDSADSDHSNYYYLMIIKKEDHTIIQGEKEKDLTPFYILIGVGLAIVLLLFIIDLSEFSITVTIAVGLVVLGLVIYFITEDFWPNQYPIRSVKVYDDTLIIEYGVDKKNTAVTQIPKEHVSIRYEEVLQRRGLRTYNIYIQDLSSPIFVFQINLHHGFTWDTRLTKTKAVFITYLYEVKEA